MSTSAGSSHRPAVRSAPKFVVAVVAVLVAVDAILRSIAAPRPGGLAQGAAVGYGPGAGRGAAPAGRSSLRARNLVILAALLIPIAAIAAVIAVASGGTTTLKRAPVTRQVTPVPTPATVTVARRDLTVTGTARGQLAYPAAQTVFDQLKGKVTALPAVGQVIRAGQSLFTVGQTPVVLLYGSAAAHRALQPGDSNGTDVYQLNANLVALGYNDGGIKVNDTWQPATTTGVKALQLHLQEPATGALALGDVVFLPAPQIVRAREAQVGAATVSSTAAAGSATAPTSPAPTAAGTATATANTTPTETAATTSYTAPTVARRPEIARRDSSTTTATFSGASTTVTATPPTTTAPAPGSAPVTATAPAATTPAVTQTTSTTPSPSQQQQTIAKKRKQQQQAAAQKLKEQEQAAAQKAAAQKAAAQKAAQLAAQEAAQKAAQLAAQKAAQLAAQKAASQETTTSSDSNPTTTTSGTTSTAPPSQTSPQTGQTVAALPVLSTSSADLQVTLSLGQSYRTQAKVGLPVTVELPRGVSKSGKVTAVRSAGGSKAPILLTITLTQPLVGSSLAQAGAGVEVTAVLGEARGVLAIPRGALIKQAGHGFAVRTVGSSAALIPVTTGIESGGYVQISGPGIHPGLTVAASARARYSYSTSAPSASSHRVSKRVIACHLRTPPKLKIRGQSNQSLRL